jgi:4-hydroxythreonine-4-phosphate dehydrogenase
VTRARPRIGLSPGDRNGVGPEIVARLLASPDAAACDLLLVGDPEVFSHGRRIAGIATAPDARLLARRGFAGEPIGMGTVRARAGAEVLEHLAVLTDLAVSGEIDGFVFAPLNKNAMRLAGLAAGDELDAIRERLGFHGNCGELNVLGDLWTARVTSHVPLRAVGELITAERVLDAIALLRAALVASGRAAPRIAVAGLNPHAGDGGAFGDEEIREIAPAVERARAAGIDVSGPYPADTVFVAAHAGRYDAVVSMYHDQGQIAMKLLGFGRGVTVLAGLPMPVTTVGHGTAYDIVGRGVARPDGLFEALRICRAMAEGARG